MARIRTIKPEFPQSESMGNVSREARLLFPLLWTIADDHGKCRGTSRMLASLLFPYDQDAPALIDDWLSELERQDCIQRYQVGGASYIKVTNWLKHQRIDKPSKSKFPDPEYTREPSANTREPSRQSREPSSGDQGSKDQGPKDQGSKDRRRGPEDAGAADGLAIPLSLDRRPEALAFKAYQAAAERYGWAPVMDLTPKRRRGIKARMARAGGLDGWMTALGKASRTEYLQGKPWFGLDWMLDRTNFTRLMESKYDSLHDQVPTGQAAEAAGIDSA